ncbi:MAG: hypothetical protein IPH28_21145 [Cytophagaceae bacterium]|nr:hypothetical protein [Cytophagaceae bacterium]
MNSELLLILYFCNASTGYAVMLHNSKMPAPKPPALPYLEGMFLQLILSYVKE